MKILWSFLLLCISTVCYSQEQELVNYSNVLGGSFFVNSSQNNSQPIGTTGQLIELSSGFNSTTITETKNSSFNFAPYYGRRLNSSLMVGLLSQFSTSKYKTTGYLESTVDITGQILLPPNDETLTESNANGVAFSLYARYYFNTTARFQFFVEPRIGWSKNESDSHSVAILNNERLTNESYYERSVLNFNLIPGIHYAIGNRFNILVSMGFLSYQFGNQTTGSIRDSRLIDFVRPPVGDVTQETDRTVTDLTLSLRMSSLNFGFEFKF